MNGFVLGGLTPTAKLFAAVYKRALGPSG
jgi:hypothetical protein